MSGLFSGQVVVVTGGSTGIGFSVARLALEGGASAVYVTGRNTANLEAAVARLGLGSALRRLADAGERCVLHLLDGTSHEATLRRVGADFVEAVEGEGRIVLVAFAAVAAVQSRD